VKSYVLDSVCLDGFEVGLGGEAPVPCRLPGHLAIDALVPDDHLGGQQVVGRIAVFDGAVGD